MLYAILRQNNFNAGGMFGSLNLSYACIYICISIYLHTLETDREKIYTGKFAVELKNKDIALFFPLTTTKRAGRLGSFMMSYMLHVRPLIIQFRILTAINFALQFANRKLQC